MSENYWNAQRSPWAFIALAVELACVVTAWYISWIAGCAVIIAIFTQSAWQLYLAECEKEQA